MCQQLLLFKGYRSVFSNFYNCPVVIGNNSQYRTAEHYYQSWKAAYFGDQARWEAIKAAPWAGQAKYLARDIKNFDRRTWELVAPQFMEAVVYQKFSGNAEAREKLLNTGDAILVEACTWSNFWGSGLDLLDDAHADLDAWKGANVLGQILMKVRERLRNGD